MAKTSDSELTRADAKVLADRCVDYITQAMADYTPAFEQVFANRAIMNYEQPIREELTDERENAERSEKRNHWKSRLVVPYAKNAKKGLLSHLLPFILDVSPFFGFDPDNRESKLYRHAKENYQQKQLAKLETPWTRTVQTLIDAALTDMTSILKIDWETRYSVQTRWQLPDEFSSEAAPVSETVLEYDGPVFTLIPFEQVVTFPRAGWDLQRSPGVAVNIALTGEEIVARCAMLLEHGGYWPDVAEVMREVPPDMDDTDDVPANGDTHEVGNAERGVKTGSSSTEFLSGKYNCTEIYWRGETESTIDGVGQVTAGTDRFLVIHQPSGTVLRCGKNPWWKGQRNYAYVQGWLDRDGLGGDAIRTTGAGHVQEGLTELVRSADNTMRKGLDPPMLTTRSLGLDMEDYRDGNVPGGEIPMSEAYWQNGGDKLKPQFTAELDPTMIQSLTEYYISIGEKCTGDSGAMEQSPTGTEITATQAEQIVEGSQAGLLLIARNLMYGLRQVGELLDAMNYQFLFNPGPQKLWQSVNGELTLPAPPAPPAPPQDQPMPQMGAQLPTQMSMMPLPAIGQPSNNAGQLPTSPPVAFPGGEGAAPQQMPQLPQAPPPLPPQPITLWETYTKAQFTVVCNGVDSANKQIRHLRALEIMKVAMADQTIWMNPNWRYAILYNVFETLDGQKDTATLMGEHDEYLARDAEDKQEAQQHEQHVFEQAMQIEQTKHEPKPINQGPSLDQQRAEGELEVELAGKKAFKVAAGTESGKVIGAELGADITPPDPTEEKGIMQQMLQWFKGITGQGGQPGAI